MKISVIIPCLNEENTIAGCIIKAKSGIAALGCEGEVLVADNGSTDHSKEIAERNGAVVINVPKRGYGSAIRSGIDSATGTYVVIGDADGSYDFSVLPTFIEKLESADYDLVIGNRFKGGIEKNAMPLLNKYLGNPLISFLGRTLFGNVCSDFCCGLRAGKRTSLVTLGLSQNGMIFAIEMIVKSISANQKISEVPVVLYRDGRGRPPHLRRWSDGWKILIFMFNYKFSKEK